ncbi:hypothetical protein GCK32_009262 [Trichostrongylus colubriformis]|uniref:Uncharacterized protein n=1 Tax=Trichostrongylus colubriformis TaxID=6319 RepID=A0AAN8G1H2_TRICO
MAQKRALEALERRPRIMGPREGPKIGQTATKRRRTELDSQGPLTADSSAAPSSASSVVSVLTSKNR